MAGQMLDRNMLKTVDGVEIVPEMTCYNPPHTGCDAPIARKIRAVGKHYAYEYAGENWTMNACSLDPAYLYADRAKAMSKWMPTGEILAAPSEEGDPWNAPGPDGVSTNALIEVIGDSNTYGNATPPAPPASPI